MICIFCLNERPESVEHVFPYAIGGSLTTNRVCVKCNSYLGAKVDSALSNNFLVRTLRARFNIRGTSGDSPSVAEILEGTAHLADGSGTLRAIFNEKSGKLDLKLHTSVTEIESTPNSKTYQFKMDFEDIERIPKLLQRIYQKHGKPPLTNDEIAIIVEKARASAKTIDNPEVRKTLSADFSFIRHALFKIAYELCFLWLGDDYIQDPLASDIRKALLTPDPASLDDIEGLVVADGDQDVFALFQLGEHEHAVLSGVAGNKLVVAIRIFDVYIAKIPMTTTAARYLPSILNPKDLRWLSVDSRKRTYESTNLHDKLLAMMLERRARR